MIKDLVFNDALERRLHSLMSHPSESERFLLFFGEPGSGKTTFAKRFAQQFSTEDYYFPMNETGLSEKLFETINKLATYTAFCEDDERPFKRVIILDEFHNISRNKQDKFKTLYDEVDSDVRIIYVLNTELRKKSLSDILSPAMRSRCDAIDFNVREKDKESYFEKIKHLYPYLRRNDVLANIHDHRKLNRLNKNAHLML